MIKESLRDLLVFLHLDLTRNLKYDRLTRAVLRKVLKKDSNCIDVGCHKGEILRLMLQYSPDGHHYAFEPIPHLFDALVTTFKNQVQIFPYALADRTGESTFQLVKNAPAYSGLKKRRYDVANPDIEEIRVALKTLDETIGTGEQVHFIKIDVEGGEFGVLKGAKNLLKTYQPVVLFECGKGASDYYGTAPADLFHYLADEIGMAIYTLQAFVREKAPLRAAEFVHYFDTNAEYYFVASAR